MIQRQLRLPKRVLSALKSVHCDFGKYSSRQLVSYQALFTKCSPVMGCPFHQQRHRAADGGSGATPLLEQHQGTDCCVWHRGNSTLQKDNVYGCQHQEAGDTNEGFGFGECWFRKGVLLKMQGVSWHCCELVCRTGELFPERVDMTFTCLSHYPPCFIGDLLIWQNAEYYWHENYLSSWRTGSCCKDRFHPRLAGWSPFWVISVCWRVHPFFHLPIIVSWDHLLSEQVVLLLRLGAVLRDLFIIFFRNAWERALLSVFPFCFRYQCPIRDLSRLDRSLFHHLRFRMGVHVISIQGLWSWELLKISGEFILPLSCLSSIQAVLVTPLQSWGSWQIDLQKKP